MQQRFKDKVVIVTGASRGIGRAIALGFAREGAKTVINYHASEKEARTVEELIKGFGGECFVVQADVADESAVKSLIQQTFNHFGGIDILVNNAGIVIDKSFSERTLSDWERTMQTNLYGPFLCAKYAAPHLLKSSSGRIINISSTNGLNGFCPDSMDYDSSKAALIQLTKNLAQELAPKVLVNSVAPGWVNTDINKDLSADFVAKETEHIYLKRFASPEEMACPVLFLASEEASFITGQTLVVDGGTQ